MVTHFPLEGGRERRIVTGTRPWASCRSMSSLPRPGCLVRSTLALLGVLFVPLGIWFLRDGKHRYWDQSAALFVGAIVCFYFAFRRDSWLMTALDGLD
jgi:hypothetical protein